jgi:hypothetical protein
MRSRLLALGFLALAVLGPPAPARAHGLAGKRFFPATLAIEDPFVADELSLPSVLHLKGPAGKETSLGAELAKTITPNLGLSIEGEYTFLNPSDPEKRSTSGFANPELALKYSFFKSDDHEAILSLSLGWEIGGAGDKDVGAESFHVLSPALLFGKGLGDLPDTLAYLRPLAVTGIVGAEVPLTSKEGNSLTYGVAIAYSLPYLQQFVRDIGIPAGAGRFFPVVELLLKTPIDGEERWKTTGTVNPGLIWAGKFVEVGVEAVIPINTLTGKSVGVQALLHFFLDDLYPAVFRPIFGQP